MVIKQLKPEHAKAWFDFFDNRAFADHEEWQGCYCTGPFTPRMKEYKNASRRRRDYAIWLVEHGIMKGYLAFDNARVVGWCNVGDKGAFSSLGGLQTPEDKVISITCFTIQKEYRARGVAQRLLQRVIKEAKANKKKLIEAYPSRMSKSEFGNFHGPFSMYEKYGFKPERIRGVEVVRLHL